MMKPAGYRPQSAVETIRAVAKGIDPWLAGWTQPTQDMYAIAQSAAVIFNAVGLTAGVLCTRTNT
jgi:hypothetical protein